MQNDISIGYLPQVMVLSDNHTVIEETEKAFSHIQELKEKLQYYAAGEAVSITVQSPGEGGIYTEKELTITLSSAQSSEESQSTDNTQAAPEKGNGTHKAMGYQN